MKPLTPDEMHAVATVLCLVQDRKPNQEQRDEHYGMPGGSRSPTLEKKLRDWLKEQL